MKSGKVYEDAWNETAIELVSAAEAHCRVFLVETYYNAFNEITSISNELKVVLKQLMELYAVYTVLRNVGDLLRVRIEILNNFVLTITILVYKCAWTRRGKFAEMVGGFINCDKTKCRRACGWF